jgi:excisionase family DNA binding protein
MKMLTVNECANILGISRNTVYREINKNKIKVTRLGLGTTRINPRQKYFIDNGVYELLRENPQMIFNNQPQQDQSYEQVCYAPPADRQDRDPNKCYVEY